MKKKIMAVFAIALLSGCATKPFYTFEGKKYNSREQFHQAIEASLSNALFTVVPLPSPLAARKLIFAIPSESAIREENNRRFITTQGRVPTRQEKEIRDNLSKSAFRNIQVFFEAVQKRNIYTSVQLIEMDSMTGSFAASAESDALFFVEPTEGSGQWYSSSFKSGKQIFAYDRGLPGPAGKLKGFIDAVQAQAIRE